MGPERSSQHKMPKDEMGSILSNYAASTETALLVTGGDGRIIYANPAAAVIFENPGLEGASFEDMVPAEGVETSFGNDRTKICQAYFRASEYSQTRSLLIVRTSLDGGMDGLSVVSVTDITSCKDKEEEAARDRNLLEIGRFAAYLAHEIKNPITGIKGVMEMMSSFHKKGDPRFEIFQEALASISRLDTLVKDLLSLSKQLKPSSEKLLVRDLVESSIHLAENSKDIRGAKIRRDLGNLDVHISGDPILLQQVFVNLVLNAVDAVGGKGNVVVTAVRINSSVSVSVTDDGPGIDAETLPHIFEPFFTTKSHGTGLGLAIVQRILQLHRASIRVISQEDKGATFTVTFPVLEG